MKILICGSRGWTDPRIIWRDLEVLAEMHPDAEIIHGAARGADTIAGEAAKALGLKVTEVPAQWTQFGPSAGPIRNKQMLDMAPDRLIAYRCAGESKGTDHMVKIARRAGVPIRILDPAGRVHTIE